MTSRSATVRSCKRDERAHAGMVYAAARTLRFEPITPAPPGPGHVRIDVAYTGICGTDLHIYHGDMDSRVHPPQVIGHEMSGRIAETGNGVDGSAGRRTGHRDAAGLVRTVPSLPGQPHSPVPQPELPRHRLHRSHADQLDGPRTHPDPAARPIAARSTVLWSSPSPWPSTTCGGQNSSQAKRPWSSAAVRSACSSPSSRAGAQCCS